jgi:S-(hydroxymethyl)glutathione dehydrogenase / alcohol dehydrogenase
MRAAVLHEMPGRLTVEDVDVDLPSAQEVLIRTGAAGLCHSDLHVMNGTVVRPLPAVLGHESAGVVEAVGDDVTYVRPGDHVATCLSAFCGLCDYCLTGRGWLCTGRARTLRAPQQPPRLSLGGVPVFAMSGLASFAEQLLVHQNSVVKIDPEMPLDAAALLGCGVITGVGAVFNAAQVTPGSSVAVIGCGGVGLNCVQGAAIAGANTIIAIDIDPFKLNLARTFGATEVIDSRETDPVEAVLDLTAGGAEYSFEVIGLPATITQAMRMIRPGGLASIIGVLEDNEIVPLAGKDLRFSRRLQGVSMGHNRFRVDIPRLVRLYLQGRLKVDELISRRIGLDDVNDGYDLLRAGAPTARSVVTFP